LLEGGLSSEAVSACLKRLAAKDILVLDSRSGEILGAYPFSARPTRHRVSFGAQTAYAMCAIDALGMAAMLGRKVQVESRCPLCGGAIAMKADARTIEGLEPASVVVWLPNESEARKKMLCRLALPGNQFLLLGGASGQVALGKSGSGRACAHGA
jgi:hypothetical protein